MAITKTINIKVNAGQADKELKKISKSSKKTTKDVKATGGAMATLTGGAAARFSGLIASLKGVALGFRSIGFAIAASGIGLILLAIVAITAAFKNSEEGQNRFAKIMGVIGSVVGNLVDLLADFGNFLLDIFSGDSEAMKKMKSFGKSIFDVVGLPLKNIIDTVKALGKVLTALFNRDLSGAFDALKQGISDIKDNFIEAKDSIVGATDALKSFGKELIQDMSAADIIADQRAKADKIDRKLIVERAKANQKIADLRFKSEQRVMFSAGERVKFLQEASQVAEDISKKEIVSANLRLSAQIAENKLAGSKKADLNKVAQLTAKVIDLDTQKLNLQKRLQTSIITFQREEAAGIALKKKIKDEKGDKVEADEKKKQDAILKIREIFRIKNEDFDDETELLKIEREEKRALAELERLGATEDQKIELLKYFAQKRADELNDITKTAGEKEAEDEKRKEETIQNLKVDIERNTVNLILNIAKRGSKVAKAVAVAEVVREQVKSISQTISAIGVANAKAVAASPITLGQPFVTLNTIAGITGMAASATGAARAIKDILSDKRSVSGGGGGFSRRGGAASAPSFNLVAGSGSNQIAQGLANQPTPIRAFVVSGEVTSAQSLDRNIQDEGSI